MLSHGPILLGLVSRVCPFSFQQNWLFTLFMAKLLGKPKLIPPFCGSTFKRQDILPAQLPMPTVLSIPPAMPSILHTCWRILTACNEFVSYASQNGTKWLWWFVQLKKRTFWHAIKEKNRFLHWSKPPSEKCSCTWRVSFLFQSKHDDHIGIEKWGIPPYHGIPLHLRQS